MIWGIYHGSLLVIERLAKNFLGWRPTGIGGLIITFPFGHNRLDILPSRLRWADASVSTSAVWPRSRSHKLLQLRPVSNRRRSRLSCTGIFFAFAPLKGWERLRVNNDHAMGMQLTFALCSLAYSALLLAANSFNPFIYFRF